MFFIVPTLPKTTNSGVERPTKVPRLSSSDDINSSGYYRRRVPTACDRCRLKKARCSEGQAPCKKCKRDGVLCVISRDRAVDTMPKAPGYVKMVESQRDLLLRTVVELQQRSDPQKGAPPDVNKVLQELNIRVGEPHNDSCSLLQDSSLLQISPAAGSTSENNPHTPCLDLPDLENPPWADIMSMGIASMTGAAASSEANLENNISGEAMRKGGRRSEYLPEELLDTYQFGDSALQTQWESATDDPYFGYDANFGVSTFSDMDVLQQQFRQNSDVEFSNRSIMQDAL